MQIVESAARTDFPSDLVYPKGGVFQRVDSSSSSSSFSSLEERASVA